MSKKIVFSQKAREGLKRGMEKVYKALSISLGPRGRYALLDRKNKNLVYIDDGATIAKEISLEEEIEDAGATMLKESSLKTNDLVGDGTTTSAILANAIIREAHRVISSGFNPVMIADEIQEACHEAVKIIKEIATQVATRDQKLAIANISCLDKELAELVVDAVEEAGSNGYVTIEEGNSVETVLEISEGLKIKKGWISPYFANTQEAQCVLDDCLVFLTDGYLDSIAAAIKILETANKKSLPILIVCDGVSKEVLSILVVNKTRGTIKCAAIKIPGYGVKAYDHLEDIALLTDGKIVSEALGMKAENASFEIMGKAKKVIINKEETTIFLHDEIRPGLVAKIERLKKESSQAASDYAREHLEERIAALSGKIAVIRVGGLTETEILAKKMKIEDSKNCLLAALKEGVVPGGGSAYLFASGRICGHKTGWAILKQALKFPARLLADNSGYAGTYVTDRLLGMKFGTGFDVSDGQFKDFTNLIMDPALVEIRALEHAVSIAKMFIKTECVISEKNRP